MPVGSADERPAMLSFGEKIVIFGQSTLSQSGCYHHLDTRDCACVDHVRVRKQITVRRGEGRLYFSFLFPLSAPVNRLCSTAPRANRALQATDRAFVHQPINVNSSSLRRR